MLLLYILWDDWIIFMIPGSKEELQHAAGIGIHPTKTWLKQLGNFKKIWTWGHFRRTICNNILFELGKNTTETYGMLQTVFGASCMNRASVLSGIRDLRKAGSLWGMMRDVGWLRKSIHQSWLAKGLDLELGLLYNKYITRCTAGCWFRSNSQHGKNCVCLSLRVENLKLKKVIKVSYLNQESRQCFECFSDSYVFEHFMHLNILAVYYRVTMLGF